MSSPLNFNHPSLEAPMTSHMKISHDDNSDFYKKQSGQAIDRKISIPSLNTGIINCINDSISEKTNEDEPRYFDLPLLHVDIKRNYD